MFGAAYSAILQVSLDSFLPAHRYQTLGAVSPAWVFLTVGKAGAFLLCAGQNFHVLELV